MTDLDKEQSASLHLTLSDTPPEDDFKCLS